MKNLKCLFPSLYSFFKGFIYNVQDNPQATESFDESFSAYLAAMRNFVAEDEASENDYRSLFERHLEKGRDARSVEDWETTLMEFGSGYSQLRSLTQKELEEIRTVYLAAGRNLGTDMPSDYRSFLLIHSEENRDLKNIKDWEDTIKDSGYLRASKPESLKYEELAHLPSEIRDDVRRVITPGQKEVMARKIMEAKEAAKWDPRLKKWRRFLEN